MKDGSIVFLDVIMRAEEVIREGEGRGGYGRIIHKVAWLESLLVLATNTFHRAKNSSLRL